MSNTPSGKNPFGVPYYDLTIKLDEPAFAWLEKEAKRTGLSIETVAAALLRTSCYEEKQIEG